MLHVRNIKHKHVHSINVEREQHNDIDNKNSKEKLKTNNKQSFLYLSCKYFCIGCVLYLCGKHPRICTG